MAFRVEERFEVEAPIERVWRFLIDPRRVVVCLPGAEVTEVVDEQTYVGQVTVKVGPVTARYKGTVRLEEADEARHTVRLSGEGKEAAGSGTAKMSMAGNVSDAGEGRTIVSVDADIDIAGKMARFGRGVMEDVSRQLFHEFAQSTQKRLEEESAAADETLSDEDAGQVAALTEHTGQARPVDTGASETAAASSDPLSAFALLFRTIRSRVKRLFGG